jgi:glycosyltransferase involved in cell wall biosynthesis
LRILHLGKFYPPHAGGVERHLAQLAAAQAAAGHEIAALVHAAPKAAGPATRWDDNGVLVDPVACHGQIVFVPFSPAWPLHLARLLRDFRPDLLHVHVPNPSAFWMLLSPAARRLPWVVHWHADIPEDSTHAGLRLGYPVYRAFERALNARARAIVATSRTYLDASRALAPMRAKSRVLPLGMADAQHPGDAPEWPGRGVRLLAVGRLSYYKGFDVLLDAIARSPGITLLLVGAGEQYARLQARIDELDLSTRVRMAGNLDDATLEAAYQACDLFCLPSIDRAEAFGMVLLEAMRAGKAVVASAIPGSGVGTVVVDGETGALVPPRDVDALARALRELAAAPALRERYGEAGRRRWEKYYRIDAVTRQWLDLYREVLADPAPGPTTSG